jgi:hypothetical protein
MTCYQQLENRRRFPRRIARLSLFVAALVITPLVAQAEEWPPFREHVGVLPDGTAWLIRTPENWNGTLLRDLDFSTGVAGNVAGRYQDLLRRGYAFAGLARHPLRLWQYDPQREIENLQQVQTIFSNEERVPDRVLQYGCSGGGHVGLASAEEFSDKIDGAVILAAHTPVWIMKSYLDGWFAMQALLSAGYESEGLGSASELEIVHLPNSVRQDGRGLADIQASWRRAIEAAGATPEGRARIALAFAIGQWSPWQSEGDELPDLTDAQAMAEMIVRSAMRIAGNVGGTSRLIFENAASGQQLSGNEKIDYVAFYEAGAPLMKELVERLYADADLDINADLAQINASPRVASSDYALNFWSQPGRTVRGNLQVPAIRIHMLGDNAIPYTLMQGYETLVEENGKGDLYRQVLVNAAGHCEFTAAESTAAVEAIMKRLDTGEWPDISADSLNDMAADLQTDTQSRFMNDDEWRVGKFNRAWLPEE